MLTPQLSGGQAPQPPSAVSRNSGQTHAHLHSHQSLSSVPSAASPGGGAGGGSPAIGTRPDWQSAAAQAVAAYKESMSQKLDQGDTVGMSVDFGVSAYQPLHTPDQPGGVGGSRPQLGGLGLPVRGGRGAAAGRGGSPFARVGGAAAAAAAAPPTSVTTGSGEANSQGYQQPLTVRSQRGVVSVNAIGVPASMERMRSRISRGETNASLPPSQNAAGASAGSGATDSAVHGPSPPTMDAGVEDLLAWLNSQLDHAVLQGDTYTFLGKYRMLGATDRRQGGTLFMTTIKICSLVHFLYDSSRKQS